MYNSCRSGNVWKSLSHRLELSCKPTMVDSAFLAFMSSSCDENDPPILLLSDSHFPEVIYFFKCSVHITCPYSRCGLTKVVNNFLNRGPSRHEKILRIDPAIAFAFFTFTEMCSSNFSSASRITPRSFCSKTYSSSCRWRVHFSVSQRQDMTFFWVKSE